MLMIDANTLADCTSDSAIVNALRDAFRKGCEMPERHHHTVAVPNAPDGTLLLMPAWRRGEHLGIKIATVFPGNAAAGGPSVNAIYLLLDANTGRAVAQIDGGELTARRTAATSVLAAQYLARRNAESLLIVGTGRIARHLLRCYLNLHTSIRQVSVWGRNPARSEALIRDCGGGWSVPMFAVTDLDAAVNEADIVSCATLSETPLIHGECLKPGTHVDLIGSFAPSMREADDEVIRRARIFCDSPGNAANESGEFIVPIANGVLNAADIQPLAALCRADAVGRRDESEITLFKSVGAAIEDLAIAELAVRSAGR
jgi:ornithine cyclodeaminase